MVVRVFQLELFSHWDQMSLYIDDYPYSGMSYCGDPDLPFRLVEYGGPMVSDKLIVFYVHVKVSE